jgi:Mitochondrial K+-H+ exchange-related
MDVYLVPVGPDKHELYCEVPDEQEEDRSAAESQGFFRRLRHRFSEMLAEAERERRQARTAATQGQGAPPADTPGPAVAAGEAGTTSPVEGSAAHSAAPSSWMTRVKSRVMRWVAETIAEQRVLWHLRRQTEACLYYPDDLDEAQAMAALRAQLSRDFDKHRFWLTINALAFVASGVFFFVPGPNFIAYYFAFRLVGHYLSLRGARQGLSGVQWRTRKSAELSELRRAIGLAPEVRVRRVNEVALRLRLEHLPSFFERTVVPMS